MTGDWAATPSETGLTDHDRSDAQIVERCLGGDQEAWSTLLERYQRLIHSIPLKYGATPDDAADIFQAVSMDLYADLGKLRNPGAVRAWLIQVTLRRSLQWKQTQQRRAEDELSEFDAKLPDCLVVPPLMPEDLEDDERLGVAVARLPGRFQELIRMLFYEQPPRPYKEIAEALGLARGSIPFLRARCLKRIQQTMAEIELESHG